MNERLKVLIEKELLWDSSEVAVEYQQDGLTNQSYVITKDDMKYAVRICNQASEILHINRNAEYAAMKAAAELGVGAEIVFFSKETGDMITKFVEGKKWSFEDAATKENITRIANTMKKVHSLPAIPYLFSPYQDIEDKIEYASKNHLALPEYLELLLNKLNQIKEQRELERSNCTGLCHNDPFPNNFIDDGSVRLIDWEYAGMGDIYFDLACICVFYTPEKRADFLEQYFGQCDAKKLQALEQMSFVVQFWNAMWAVLQTKSSDSPQNYEAMANSMFANMKMKLL
jgi:thiamine kinase-like enzyme